jgi:hypothetical protein
MGSARSSGHLCSLNPDTGYADYRTMTWLLVVLVIAAAAVVMLGILGEGTNARRRAGRL